MRISVLLADDHGLVRSGIKSILEDSQEIVVIDEAADGDEALEKVAEKHPDVLLIDIKMPRLNGLEAIRQLPQYSTKTRAIVLSMHNSEDYVLQSIAWGASGYLIKDASKDELITAIKAVHRGEKFYSGSVSQVLVDMYLESLSDTTGAKMPDSETAFDLTRRERQILDLIVKGKSNKEIADLLRKSVRTIETHRFNLMKKLEVNNFAELLAKVSQYQLIEPVIYE